MVARVGTAWATCQTLLKVVPATMTAVDASSDFREAVKRAALDLAGWPENFSDAHIHFDDRVFAGLVPEFSDPEWLRLGAVAADVTAQLPESFLIQVPMAELDSNPSTSTLPQSEVSSLGNRLRSTDFEVGQRSQYGRATSQMPGTVTSHQPRREP